MLPEAVKTVRRIVLFRSS